MPSQGITRFAVSNYKPFEHTADVALGELTVVFGANGSGKSALVRVPLALAGALRPGPDDGPGLPWEARGIKLGSSLISLCNGGVPTEFTVEADIGGATVRAIVGRAPGSSAHLPGQWVTRWTGATGADSVDVAWDAKSKSYRGAVARFRGLMPLGSPPTPEMSRLTDALALRVEHLGPRRDPGDGSFVVADPRPSFDVGSAGADTARVLAALFGQSPDGLAAVRDAVASVMGVELDVQTVQAGDSAGVWLQARRVGQRAWQPLAELGTGFGHVLPVIVQQVAARVVSDPPDLLIVEEPESHLHPERQAELADVFLDTVRSGRCRSLVETHSETFILRLQRRVAEDPSLAPRLRFVFIDDEGSSVAVRSLGVEPNGDVPDWPTGWFDAALHEAQALHAARRRSAP